jgi:circadian clock protein KaiC
MERVKTWIKGLDEMLDGGFLPETANLVEGAPGTGKTTLGMQFIYNGITQAQEPGLILTFEEFPQQYYRDAASFGWDFRALEQAGRLRTLLISPEVSLKDLTQVGGVIERAAREIGAPRLLVGSQSHLEGMAPDPVALRGLAYGFINGLKREGLTAVITRESDVLFGDGGADNEDLAYVVDSYILLRYVEIESALRKALLVLKLRGSNHAKDIRQFELTGHGLEVQAKFEGQEGILSGSPHHMAASFVEAFVRDRR